MYCEIWLKRKVIKEETTIEVSIIASWKNERLVVQVLIKINKLHTFLLDIVLWANVITEELFYKLNEIISHPSHFNLKMIDKKKTLFLRLHKNIHINIVGMKFNINVVIINMTDVQKNLPMILWRLWVNHAKFKQEWALS